MPRSRAVSHEEFQTLAAFRYVLARFLEFSEGAAASAGLTPRQYQALLALKGFGGSLTVGDLAERLQVHHHSAVGLVDRLELLGLVRRTPDARDRRRVHVQPSPKGEERVNRLAALHRDELRRVARILRDLVDRLAGAPKPEGPRPRLPPQVDIAGQRVARKRGSGRRLGRGGLRTPRGASSPGKG